MTTYQPTEADANDALQRAVKILDDAFNGEGDGAGSAYDNVSDFLENVSFPGDSGLRSAAGGFRSGLASAIQGLGRTLLAQVFSTYLTLAGKNGNPLSPASWADVVKYWQDKGLWIKSQNAGRTYTKTGGTGLINVHILKRDSEGYEMEGLVPGVFQVETVNTEPQVAPGGGELIGTLTPRFDLFSYLHRADSPPEYFGDGAAIRFTLNNTGQRGDRNLLSNSDFSSGGVAIVKGSVTSLPGWNVSDLTKIAIVTGGYRSNSALQAAYRLDSTLPEKLQLEIDGEDVTLSQQITFERNGAYHAGLWLSSASATATGSLILTVGAISRTINVSALTSTPTWYGLVDETTLSNAKNYWGRNLQTTNNQFKIVTSSLANDIQISNARFVSRIPFNGCLVDFEPGSTFVEEDYTATFTFSVGTSTKINKFLGLCLGPGYYLPATNSAIGITASGGRTLTFAASGSSLTASSGSFVTDGYQVGMILTVASSSSNNGSYTIATVSATVITVEETFVDEGPISSTTTLQAAPSVPDPS